MSDTAPTLKIDLITALPGMLAGVATESLMARAIEAGIVSLQIHDLRDWAEGPHRCVDDTPFGGGGGMILMAEPVVRAVEDLVGRADEGVTPRVVIPTPRAPRLTQADAFAWGEFQHLIFVCGHYTGIDERIYDILHPIRVSLGDYVLSGGELAAAVMIDAVCRTVPGFLGNADAAEMDSFHRDGLGPAQYTKPRTFRGHDVPEVLISGHHENVRRFREDSARETTRRFRPDLMNHEQRNGGTVSKQLRAV